MISRIGLIGNLRKKGLVPLCRRIMNWCQRHDITIHAEKELYQALIGGRKTSILNPESLDSCDLICLMGGDGFLLNSCRLLYPTDVPVLPVNLGSLGFHTQIEPEEIIRVLNRFHANSIPTVPRYLLQVASSNKQKKTHTEFAFNDILLVKETRSRLIHVEAYIDGIFIGKVPCDGMVVSSATGSTAYNLSTGGSLVHPDLDVMILFPLCPHTLSIRPIALPGKSRITLRHVTFKDREEAKICIDGQLWRDIQPGDGFEISTAERPLLIAEAHPGVFYKKLNTVIRWGASFVRKP
ncbi:NAD(+)/NADH kinase [Candidatus Sumerlaeota bacterium]|nr:NAD(+)/NADH kinase [Candidatus Sumerlaeota bacterium]